MKWTWSIVCSVGLLGCSLLTDLDSLAPIADAAAPNLEGIYVDGKVGTDFNGGTRTAPVKTIAKGVALAKQQGAGRVYVCAQGAPYDEHVSIDAAISLIGSVTCKDAPSPWTATDDRTVITPSTPGPALTISGAKGLVIQGFAMSTPDGNAQGPDSVVAVVSTSQVTFDHVTMQAGRGNAGGTKVVTPDNHVVLTPANSASDMYTAGGTVTCTCIDGTKTTGGAGGGGGGFNAGANGTPALGGGKGGVSVAFGNPTGPCAGGKGADGSAGASGTTAAVRVLAAAGLSADVRGGDGKNGTVAQGGGGGGSNQLYSTGAVYAAGGGGCGGCGGSGGKSGVNGGWSVALVVFRSTIGLVMTSSRASAAGDGQPGGDGQAGEPGEPGGGGACLGGGGGSGKGGGAGAGGNGGSSIAIAFTKDSALTLDATSESGLEAGTPGKGAAGGSGVTTLNGVDGITATRAPF